MSPLKKPLAAKSMGKKSEKNDDKDFLLQYKESIIPIAYFDPPYDSPIEDEFAYHIFKYISSSTEVIPQKEIVTFCKTYRVDFFIKCGEQKVIVECDGAMYHDFYRDLIRDTLILGTGQVKTIFRLKGKNILYNINDLLWLLCRYCPEIFTERGCKVLTNLVSKATLQCQELYKPFLRIKNEPFKDNPELPNESEFPDEYNIPWVIEFEARSFLNTNIYYYMFSDFWDIIKFYRLKSLKEIEVFFSDIPSMIDKHHKMLYEFSKDQYEAYKRIIRDMQIVLYGNQ